MVCDVSLGAVLVFAGREEVATAADLVNGWMSVTGAPGAAVEVTRGIGGVTVCLGPSVARAWAGLLGIG